jgi:predicted nucleic acid-binding protein
MLYTRFNNSSFGFDTASLGLAFRLMEQYRDCPMDFADASLVAAAQQLQISEVFTVDRNDFYTYRFRVGHEQRAFSVIAG